MTLEKRPGDYSFWWAEKCATMGCFTPKYPETRQQVMEWFHRKENKVGIYAFCLKF